MLKNLAAIISRWIRAMVALVKTLMVTRARGLLITLAVWAVVAIGVFCLVMWLVYTLLGGWVLGALGVGGVFMAGAVARAR